MIPLEPILGKKYPAKAHAARVAEHLVNQSQARTGIIYLEGQKTHMIEDNDGEAPFRQRRYFFYLSGCQLPDCYLTYDIKRAHLTLFIPPIDPASVVWSGLPISPEKALVDYDVDEVKYTTDLNATLAGQASPLTESTVFAIAGQVSPHTTFLNFKSTNTTLVKAAIEICRVVKDDYEIALTRRANQATAAAHNAVFKALKTATNEQELEGIFISTCMKAGCGQQAYKSIVASGTNPATLHYQNNNEPLAGRLNLLLDAAPEERCYAADVTRTVPISGKWSKESRAIYDIVLEMQLECIGTLKAGVLWDNVHAQAHKIAIGGLIKLGILKGDPIEIFESRTSVAFFPHGLGHYLGMDTHDTGGNPNYEDADTMFSYLRVRGTLPAGSIITVEPGIYFCRFIIKPYLNNEKHSRFIDKSILEKYWEVGGVRIEDDVLVTETGYENLTQVEKDPDALEDLLRG
ncbi:MAG: hypothetical protein M1814_002070 [Vezdaea aestivalis]|nr:MAG: hypothetical protein M1814_002070 [Vezdaea aestivalis]